MRIKIGLLFLALVALSLPAFSQKPTDIQLIPDFENNSIEITVIHPVGNPRRHYIREVTVTVDDSKPLIYRFFFQVGNKKVFTVNVPDLEKVKKIIIKAYPRHGGALEKEFNIQKMIKSEDK